MKMNYSFYLVLDEASCNKSPIDTLKEVIDAGITCVQFRIKNKSHHEIKRMAFELLKITRAYHIPFIINDHVEIAKEIDAEGVHIGSNDFPYHKARELLGYNKIIGLSIENEEQAKKFGHYDVDYFGVGPVFKTQTKLDAAQPIGVQGLQTILSLVSKPVVAIGGIEVQHIAPLFSQGVGGVALVSAVLKNKFPHQAAKEIANVISSSIPSQQLQTVVTIAGSDSSGGAGIQADIKTITANKAYAASVLTVLTAQNTQGVQGIFEIPAAFVEKQIDSVFADLNVKAVKIGMLYSKEIIAVVTKSLKKYKPKVVVLDPVMIAKSGDALLKLDSVKTLLDEIGPLCTLITPNLPEAEALLEIKIHDAVEMEKMAKRMGSLYKTNVLIKGGHLNSEQSPDVLYLYAEDHCHWFNSDRIQTNNTHGTGCTLSSAIASYLAQDYPLRESIAFAKAYLKRAIDGGKAQKIGKGHGPLNHNQ